MKYIYKCSGIIDELSNNFTADARGSLLSLGVINSFLAVPTAATNALVIAAILKTPSLRTPSYLLLTSLAFSDLAVGLFGQPLLAVMIFSFFNGHSVVLCYTAIVYYVVSSWTSWASIFIITAISVDRYLAIRLKIKYKTTVTIPRAKRTLALLLSLSFFVMTSPFIFKISVTTFGIIAAVSQSTCLFLIFFCYINSLKALKLHCAQVQPQGNQPTNSATHSNAIDLLKYKNLLKTMISIVILICVCYLPLIAIFLTITAPGSYKSRTFRNFMVASGLPLLAGLITTMTLNSTLNPVIYMTRMRDVREACAQILGAFFGSS